MSGLVQRPATIPALLATALLFAAASSVQSAIVVESELTDARSASVGVSYEGKIRLRNTGDEPGEVKLYQTDYAFKADGSNTYGPPGKMARSNANWIQLDSNQLSLPPNGEITVNYRVRVPSGNLSGTYWSMIMVEPVPKSSADSSNNSQDENTRLLQTLRYGLQVVTEIGTGGASELAFSNARLLERDGQRLFAVDAENTGQRWIRAQYWLELYTEAGSPVGKFDGPTKRIFPGTSVVFETPLGDIPPGKYIALAVADGGGDDLYGANVELEIKPIGD